MTQSLLNRKENVFTVLLGLAFMSIFFRHGVMNLVALLFIIALLVYRPKITWIAPFYWVIGFSIWEWVSNYFGPYNGTSIEGMGIGYHFLFFLIPLTLYKINEKAIFWGILVGASASGVLMLMQGIWGINLNDSPFRIAWDYSFDFGRTPGFNKRPWETQFIHSLAVLIVIPYLTRFNYKVWLLVPIIFIGVILPQIRAVLAAFFVGLSLQIVFLTDDNKKKLINLFTIMLLAVACIAVMASLRPNFFKNLDNGNGRAAIFQASYETFKQHPHLGIGGGEYFGENYKKSWDDLGMSKTWLYNIGHTHNDVLMLLVHHGWPALVLWLGFIIHSFLFVWRYGAHKDRVIFASLIAMHHVAGLAETYLDYSNTTYAILLCYGLAMHGAVSNYRKLQEKPNIDSEYNAHKL